MIIDFIPPPKIPTLHSLNKKPTDYTRPFCQHNALVLDEERGMVQCDNCKEEMSPLEALKILCQRVWWEENTRERQLEYDTKRVSKVQVAAFLCLFEAGITPEKFAVRWQKEDEKRKVATIEMKEKEPSVDNGEAAS